MLVRSLLLAVPIAAYTPPKDHSYEDQLRSAGRKWSKKKNKADSKCSSLTAMTFWSPGHAVESCSNADKFRSICKIKCDAPYVSVSKAKPYDAWEVQCKGEPITWKAVWTGRANNDCFFCPSTHIQDKGARLMPGWSDSDGTKIGNEIRLKFDTESLKDTCTKGFIFALKFKDFVLPDDVVIDIPGATVTFISPDRQVVTVEPNEGYSNWDNDFWNSATHDGTWAYLYASDLTELKGQWSVENHVICQDFGSLGQRVSDMSCLGSPGEPGIEYTNGGSANCPTLTTVQPVTTQPTTKPIIVTQPTVQPTTKTTTKPIIVTQPTVQPTTKTTRAPQPSTTTTTTTTRTPFIPNDCVLHGTHSMGATPNWWASGNKWSYQAYVSVPVTGTVSGGWSVEIEFKKPMDSIQFWSGTVEKSKHHTNILTHF